MSIVRTDSNYIYQVLHAIYAAGRVACIRPLTGESPYELQKRVQLKQQMETGSSELVSEENSQEEPDQDNGHSDARGNLPAYESLPQAPQGQEVKQKAFVIGLVEAAMEKEANTALDGGSE